MEGPAINFSDIIESLDEGGDKGIVEGGVWAKGAVDITAHGINISIDSQQGGVVWSTGDLFDEGGEGERFGYWECLIMVFLANTCLTVLIDSYE